MPWLKLQLQHQYQLLNQLMLKLQPLQLQLLHLPQLPQPLHQMLSVMKELRLLPQS
jgi:hypothetical protein